MPAARILSLARTSRLPIAAGEARKAAAIVLASRPSTACSISGARTPASMAGCAAANISAEATGRGCPRRRATGDLVGKELQMPGRCALLPPPAGVDHAAPRGGQEPRFRIGWRAVHRPVLQGRGKGIGEGIFGSRHVSRPGGEERDELAVAPPRDRLRRAARRCRVVRLSGISGAVIGNLVLAGAGGPPATARPERPHFDDAVAGGRATGGPGERSVEVGHLDDVVAAELLLRYRCRGRRAPAACRSPRAPWSPPRSARAGWCS